MTETRKPTIPERHAKLDKKLDDLATHTKYGAVRTRVRLRTTGDVLTQLGRTFRALMKDDIDNQTARARTCVLDSVAKVLENVEITQRLDKLEQQMSTPSSPQERAADLLRQRISANKRV